VKEKHETRGDAQQSVRLRLERYEEVEVLVHGPIMITFVSASNLFRPESVG
jgi:hypothetical protein